MPNLVIALVIVFGGWWILRQFAQTQPAQIRGLVKKLSGGAVIVLAGILAMRGAMNVAIPLFALGLGLLGQQAVFPNGMPWQRKSPGQRSRVATSQIAMELDHDSGGMDGDVLAGPLKGRRLSSLAPAEIRTLFEQCATALDQSRMLLEAWLDRNRAGWREQWAAAGERPRAPASTAMSRQEAFAVLGLKPDAAEADIRNAHRRLMKEFHPDRGGSDYLAAKINQAKDVLLQD